MTGVDTAARLSNSRPARACTGTKHLKMAESSTPHRTKSGVRTVKSVVLVGYGGYEKIKVMQFPLASTLRENEVEVKTETFGVNFADLYLRHGVVKFMDTPCVLGLECAGTVTAVGADVSEFTIGDRVCCFQYFGDLYREIVVVPEKNCYKIPDEIPFDIATALMTNYLTAYFCLFELVNLKSGQSLLVHSAAGGVGSAVVQLAKTVEGVTTFGTLSPEKKAAAIENGLDHALSHENYKSELLSIAPEGVDIVLDSKSGKHTEIGLSLLKPLGQLIMTGASTTLLDTQPSIFRFFKSFHTPKTISLLDLVMGNKAVAGFHLGLLVEKAPTKAKRVMQTLFQLVVAEQIFPKIDSIYSFDEVIEAQKRLDNRENIGKILLSFSSDFTIKLKEEQTKKPK